MPRYYNGLVCSSMFVMCGYNKLLACWLVVYLNLEVKCSLMVKFNSYVPAMSHNCTGSEYVCVREGRREREGERASEQAGGRERERGERDGEKNVTNNYMHIKFGV